MDEERAVQNVGRKIKPKFKKDNKNSESTGLQDAHNTDLMKVMKFVQTSDKEDIAEMKRDDKRGQEKKKNKGVKEVEADIEKGSRNNVERKRKKREKDMNKTDEFEMGNIEEVEGIVSKKSLEGESISGEKSGKEAKKERKKQKLKRDHKVGDFDEGERDGGMIRAHSENCKGNATEMVERKKKKKDKKKSKEDNFIGPIDIYSEDKHDEDDLSLLRNENVPANIEGDNQSTKHVANTMRAFEKKKKKYKKKENYKDAFQEDYVDNDNNGLMHADKMQNNEVEYANKKKKKKTKFVDNGSDNGRDADGEYDNRGKKRMTKSVKNGSSDTTPNRSKKKVRFSGQIEVFPLPSDSNTKKGNGEEENLIRGDRFTHEEDEIVKESVLKYIEEHDLGEEGLDMIMNCRKYPNLKGCWKEIALAVPYRPYLAIYNRARVLFLRSENRKWTQEEYDAIIKYQEEHGNQWKALADELGKHTWHVKDTWRRIKLPNLKKGHWSQEEYQKLFDLVNTDLQLKISEEKKSKHGMLRDNICWSAISDELSTRNQATCCLKWYKQLTSPMVAEGVWADSDDYRLLCSLYSLDATCMEDVDWDGLVDNRSGDICRKRWNQMVLHIGHHGNKSFAEQVEVLAQRYCPHLSEAREAWDAKPRVP